MQASTKSSFMFTALNVIPFHQWEDSLANVLDQRSNSFRRTSLMITVSCSQIASLILFQSTSSRFPPESTDLGKCHLSQSSFSFDHLNSINTEGGTCIMQDCYFLPDNDNVSNWSHVSVAGCRLQCPATLSLFVTQQLP